MLQEKVCAIRAVIGCVNSLFPPAGTSHPPHPLALCDAIWIQKAPREAPSHDIAGEDFLLHEIVDDALAGCSGMSSSRHGQYPPRVTAALSRKGVRAPHRHHQDCRREGAREAHMSALASPTCQLDAPYHTFSLFYLHSTSQVLFYI